MCVRVLKTVVDFGADLGGQMGSKWDPNWTPKSIKALPGRHLKQGLEKLTVARSSISAVTHVDNSARVQTVHKSTNPRFHQLLEYFQDLTACPILENTTFNVRDEPIVCSPNDAYRCFMATEMDILVINNFMLFNYHK